MTGTSGTMTAAELEASAKQFENDFKLEEARDAFDAALRLDPSSRTAVEGRARVAIQLREEGAAEYCSQALAYHQADPELQLQMIATAAAELGSAAAPLLESFIGRHAENVVAHELLADLRAQAGEEDRFIDSYTIVLSKNPDSKPLLMSYWGMLSRSGRHRQALESIDAKRSLFEGERDFAMLEIAIAGHAGEIDRAGKLLDSIDDLPDAQVARGLNRLQTGRPSEAAHYLESVVAKQPDNLEAWALLELAWRITNDQRHGWLIGTPGLYGASDLAISKAELGEVSATLRGLHRANAHPIGQSLRGGTQTAGQLFLRSEPNLVLLIEALAVAIRQFVNNLPAADARHPLLKHRDVAIAFGPSWSVRFTGSGYHAAHFHPGGILSSACYICVPETIADQEAQPGWLEIGRPPPELGIDLEPLATFEPRPGRLVLFPSFLFHGTRPFSGGERLSVAFDLVPVSVSR